MEICYTAGIMRILAVSILIALAAFGADDAWTKVRDLHSGTELRIYKKDAKQPLNVKMGDSTEDSLIVVVKNEEVAIPKDQIDRIDYRPPKGSRVTTQNKTETTDPAAEAPIGPNRGARVPGTSSSSDAIFGNKPDFQTIYRRTSAAPKK